MEFQTLNVKNLLRSDFKIYFITNLHLKVNKLFEIEFSGHVVSRVELLKKKMKNRKKPAYLIRM